MAKVLLSCSLCKVLVGPLYVLYICKASKLYEQGSRQAPLLILRKYIAFGFSCTLNHPSIGHENESVRFLILYLYISNKSITFAASYKRNGHF